MVGKWTKPVGGGFFFSVGFLVIFPRLMVVNLGGGFTQRFFRNFHPETLGKMIPNLRVFLFFKLVETTN